MKRALERAPLRVRLPKMLVPMSLAIFAMTACQAYVQQREAAHRVSVEQDHLRLLVFTSDLTAPYEKLGELSYTDPLNGETIGSDHINEKLRQMAITRWGQQVDAIIHVSTKVGGAYAQSMSVTGEAVKLKDPCSGCRHDISSPPP